MQVIYFTKFLKGYSAAQIGELAKNLKFDGLDLAIRAGQCVNPSNVTEALPQALEVWRAMGLTVPLATLEGSAVDPHQPDVQAIFEACGTAGIPCIKLGYWTWKAGQFYWDDVTNIRRALDGFQQLGERYGVCSLIHTHSDRFYASNASGAMHLVRGFDPRYIGVYLDPAHLALDGETLPMALDIVRGYLKMVGVKNVRYQPTTAHDGPRWKADWCLLSEGLVDWPGTIQLLNDAGYDGPLSVHGEYSTSEETVEILKSVAADMASLRRFAS